MKKFLPALVILSTACATTPRAARQEVRVIVHNADANPVMVRACSALGCSEFRRLDAGSRSAFLLALGGASRVVVEGMRGNRYVARHPVDLDPGETFRVELTMNL